MYRFFCLFLMLGAQVVLHAQEYNLPKEIGKDFIFYKSSDNKLHVLKNNNDFLFHNGVWKKTKLQNTLSKRDSMILYHEKGFNNINFKIITDKNKTYFVLNGGGPVLQLEKDSLFRIDNSVEQRNQFGAATFKHDNKLFMYGGYGFWSFKSYITYFDFSSYQWELFRTQSENQPNPRWKPIYHLIENKLYVLGGRSQLPESYMTDVVLKDLFVVDMASKTIKTLSSKVNLETPLNFHSHNNGFSFEDKRAYLNNNTVTAFDFPNNIFYNYNVGEMFAAKLDGAPIFNISDTLVFIKQENGLKKLSFISTNKIKNNLNSSFPIVTDPVQTSWFKQILFIVFIVLLMIFVYKSFSYKDYVEKLIQYDENWMYFNNKKIRITKEQSLIINLLELNGQFTSTELNSIISKNKKYAKSHLTLLRKTFIDSLNSVYKKALQSDKTLISTTKLPKDKRQLLYRASKEISQKESFIQFLFKL